MSDGPVTYKQQVAGLIGRLLAYAAEPFVAGRHGESCDEAGCGQDCTVAKAEAAMIAWRDKAEAAMKHAAAKLTDYRDRLAPDYVVSWTDHGHYEDATINGRHARCWVVNPSSVAPDRRWFWSVTDRPDPAGIYLGVFAESMDAAKDAAIAAACKAKP